MPRTLHIAEPCSQPWDTMQGSEERKHCARCEKTVVALAEMTPEEADRLVASAPPHSLCVRIEHDAEGAVLFRDKPTRAPEGRPRPMLRLAMSASLLVAACGKPEPPKPEPDPSRPEAAQTAAPSAEEKASRERAEAAWPERDKARDCPTADPKGQTAPGGNGQRAKVGAATDDQNKPKTFVTAGCVCAPGDALCDCL